MAAYYPKAPTKDRQEETANFIHSFARLFPCQVCAEDFQGIIAEHPPRVDSRYEFSQWMCEAHNKVNEHLGKPQFPCNLVDQRWSGQYHHDLHDPSED
mmetsp:Transcript_36770/g.92169  ORF Transcript_36770/g.92169 Transcript_36770/m.92169 type:complete len:98 (+) Transcript_36770:126-419(+)